MGKSKDKKLIGIMLVLLLILAVIVIVALGINTEKISTILAGRDSAALVNEQVEKGKVIVKCLDKAGNALKEKEVLTGAIGSEYKVERPEVSSYISYGNDPINKIGNYDSNDVEVIFIYEKEDGNVNIINKDNVIKVQIMNNQNKDVKEVVARIITKTEDGENLNGAKYMVTDSNNAVIRNATSNTDNLIIGSFQITEEGKDKYVVKQLVVPEGYEKLEEPIEFKIVKKLNENGEYEISLEYDEIEGVKITLEEEITIEVTNKEKVITDVQPDVKPEDKPEPKPEMPEEQPEEPEEKPDEEKEIIEENKNTGDKIVYIIIALAAAGIILVACMLIVAKNKKKEEK